MTRFDDIRDNLRSDWHDWITDYENNLDKAIVKTYTRDLFCVCHNFFISFLFTRLK